MSREAVPEGCFVPSQERCKLEDKSNTACTQVTQAVVHKRGMVEKQALTQSGRTCDLKSYIASAVQVRLNGTVEAFSKICCRTASFIELLVGHRADMPLSCTAKLFFGIHSIEHGWTHDKCKRCTILQSLANSKKHPGSKRKRSQTPSSYGHLVIMTHRNLLG